MREYGGRLLDSSGQPISQARIEPLCINFDRRDIYHCVQFYPDLTRALSCETVADGGFKLRGVPVRGSLVAKIDAPRFGTPNMIWTLDKPVDIQLKPAGAVSGCVTPAEPEIIAALKLSIFYEHHGHYPLQSGQSKYDIYGYNEICSPDQDGKFCFASVPPGQYHIYPKIDAKLPYYADIFTAVGVKPGQSVSGISIPLQHAVLLQGKVQDKQTGAGIKGVSLGIHLLNKEGQEPWYKWVETDAQGQYAAYIKPGKFEINMGLPVSDDYLPASLDQFRQIDVIQDTILASIQLRRIYLDGIVVNQSNQPVANADVFTLSVGLNQIKTDRSGKFTLRQLAKDPNAIRVRQRSANAGPITIHPAEIKEPLKIVLSDKNILPSKEYWSMSLGNRSKMPG